MRIKWHSTVSELLIPADKIKPHPENYNNGDQDEIQTSILRNGVYRPVYVNKRSKRIVGGHGLYHALMELQQDSDQPQVPVAWCSLSETDELRVVAADNEIAKRSRPDTGLLVALLRKLDGDLEGTGVSEFQFEALERQLAHIDTDAGQLAADLSGGSLDLDEGQTRLTVIIASESQEAFYAACAELDYVHDVRFTR